MEINQKKFEELVNFVALEYWGNKEKMTPETRLEKNLGITGSDGIEFLDKFITKFNIDYDEDREWQLYFNSEGFSLINFISIYNWIKGKKSNQKQYDLTLGHLTKIIESGHWIDM